MVRDTCFQSNIVSVTCAGSKRKNWPKQVESLVRNNFNARFEIEFVEPHNSDQGVQFEI